MFSLSFTPLIVEVVVIVAVRNEGEAKGVNLCHELIERGLGEVA